MTNILDQVTEASEMTASNEPIKGLLVGESGTGKTQSAITLPGKTLLIDYEDKTSILRGEPDITILKILEKGKLTKDNIENSAWRRSEKLLKELWALALKNELPYDTVFYDSTSRLSRYCMDYLLALPDAKGNPTEKDLGDTPVPTVHYKAFGFIFYQFMIKAISLPNTNVIVIAHLDEIENFIRPKGTAKIVKYYPKTFSKIRTEMASWFNEVYLAKKEQNGFFWHTEGNGRYPFLRSALNRKGANWESPLPFDLDRSPAGWELVRKVAEKREGRKDKKEGGDNIK